MLLRPWLRRGLGLVLIAGLLSAAPAWPAPAVPPGLQAVAETRLLMEGLDQANFQGLERLFREGPTDAEGWAFARGQALLIAETGNLLMLRPPHNRGRDQWQEYSAELRSAATQVARAAAGRNLGSCRLRLGELATVCNRCHQTFRVNVRITPALDKPAPTH
jgi:hypothetical protein